MPTTTAAGPTAGPTAGTIPGTILGTIPGTTTDGSCPELEALRGRLDRIDEELLRIVDARIRCCVEIAQVKSREGSDMMQPHRIGLVQRRAGEFARTHQVDADFLRRLYELMIAETCRVEDEVISAEASASGTPGTAGTVGR